MQKRAFLISLIFSLALTFTPNLRASTEKVLYAFTGGTDGAYPSSSLIMDAAGNLYGTTSGGGNPSDCLSDSASGCGVVFELTFSNGAWQESVLYAFQGGLDGQEPSGNLLFDSSGNLYGTTVLGGTDTSCTGGGCGTVFELSPGQDGNWNKTVLHNFQANTDGAYPVGLTFDLAGNLYGVTTVGGSGERGTAYKLSPPKQKGDPWTEEIIYEFADFETVPSPGLVFDAKGNLYGTYSALYGCYVGCGAVFQLKPAQGSWTETDLFDFSGGGNGGNPLAGVIFDGRGNLYGTGSEGGNNWGMAFRLMPGSPSWSGIMLHNFCSLNNCADGATPLAALVMDANGNLYGTASAGGKCLSCAGGVVFKLARTRIPRVWNETVLHQFQGGSDSGSPTTSLILDRQGNLYGTTTPNYYGSGYGTVFEVTP